MKTGTALIQPCRFYANGAKKNKPGLVEGKPLLS